MPTFHGETVLDRYQREHSSEIARYSMMSPLQIESLDIARHNAEAQCDELLIALQEVMEWINNWSPEFTYDNDWPAARDRAEEAIAKCESSQ